MMFNRLSPVLLSLLLASPLMAQVPSGDAAPPAATEPVHVETKEQKDARMGWWREARFGMFIHWGLYAVPAGVYKGQDVPSLGEWIQNNASIPVAEYAKYAEGFNPAKFDADAFVAAAKKAGMKYIVITSKHHDGFAMFESAASPFNIVDATPFKRDVIKELEAAAHKAGLRFGVYYSQSQDWHHPGGFAYGRVGRKDGTHWDPAQDGSFDEYLEKVAIPQTKELLSHYKLDVLWWDTPGPITKEQATKLHDLLALQPNIITNNRLQNVRTPGSYQGDTETPEQNIPATGFPGGRDWETCMTMNDTWGFKSTDTHYKSTETLLRNLIDIASKGGNYLLNVGPTAEGEIPGPQLERLAELGKWLEANGEAIYGTGPNPFPARPAPPETQPAATAAATAATTAAATAAATAATTTTTTGPATRRRRPPVVWDWRATTKPGKIYLHLFQWPANGAFTLPSTGTPLNITKAYLLADPNRAPLMVTTITNGGLVTQSLQLPAAAPDPIATVVCLEVQELPHAP